MKPKSAKAKGKGYEREIAKLINKKFGGDARRTPCSGALPDWPGDITKLPKEMAQFCIECKKQETLRVWQWLEQAEREAGRKTPVLVFSRNRSKSYAVIEFNDFLELVLNAWQEIE
jgi:Holliday junction resolvase